MEMGNKSHCASAQKNVGKSFNCCVAVQHNGLNITIHLDFNKTRLISGIKVI